MTFRTKILLALLIVGVVPALVTSAMSFGANRRELISTVGGAQREVATEAALFAERTVQQSVEDLRRTIDYIPFAELAPDQLQSVLSIPFRQMPALASLALLDEQGNAVVPPLVRSVAYQRHLPAFAENIPLQTALSDGTAVGLPWMGGDDGAPRIAVALRIDLPEGAVPASKGRVLAGEVVLAPLVRRLEELAQPDRFAEILGADGTVIASAAGPQRPEGAVLSPEDARALAGKVKTRGGARFELLERAGHPEWLAAAAPMPQLGWTLIVARPGEAALGPADRVARYVGYWAAFGLVLTVLMGVFVARGISRPVRQLSAAADALRAGDYTRRAEIDTQDELGRLAGTFNAMAEEIARRDREIRAFNEELMKRVELKSAELQQARDQIERSRRLEGLVSLGAGFAHEMNNPLTTVIGILSLLKDETATGAHGDLLDVAVKDAGRIADIVERFRTMVERDVVESVRFDVGAAVRDALSSFEAELTKAGIQVRTALPGDALHATGDPTQFSEAIRELLLNAAQAMPTGGELNVDLSEPEKGALKLTVSDTGHGIPSDLKERVFDPFFTTKRQAGRLGLGLTLVHRVVQAHHGKILLDSAAGRGTTVTVILPGAAGGAHLR